MKKNYFRMISLLLAFIVAFTSVNIPASASEIIDYSETDVVVDDNATDDEQAFSVVSEDDESEEADVEEVEDEESDETNVEEDGDVQDEDMSEDSIEGEEIADESTDDIDGEIVADIVEEVNDGESSSVDISGAVLSQKVYYPEQMYISSESGTRTGMFYRIDDYSVFPGTLEIEYKDLRSIVIDEGTDKEVSFDVSRIADGDGYNFGSDEIVCYHAGVYDAELVDSEDDVIYQYIAIPANSSKIKEGKHTLTKRYGAEGETCYQKYSFEISSVYKENVQIDAQVDQPPIVAPSGTRWLSFGLGYKHDSNRTIKKAELVNNEDGTRHAVKIPYKELTESSFYGSVCIEHAKKTDFEASLGDKLISFDIKNIVGDSISVYPEKGSRVYMTIQWENIPVGVYDLEVTTSDGKVYKKKTAIDVTSKAIINSFIVNNINYVTDPGKGYIAYVVYGTNIDDDYVPAFYKNSDKTEPVAIYDESDPNCAKSPDLGDGRIYKLKLYEEYTGNVCLISESEAYYNGSTIVNEEGVCNGISGYQNRQIVYSGSVSDTDGIKLYLSSSYLDSVGKTEGDVALITASSYTSSNNQKSASTVIQKDDNGYYVKVSASSAMTKAVSDGGFISVFVNESEGGIFSFFADAKTQTVTENRLLSISKAWKIRSAYEMADIIAEGAAGNAPTAEVVAKLYDYDEVILEETDSNGTSKKKITVNRNGYDRIVYNDGLFEDHAVVPYSVKKGQTVTLPVPYASVERENAFYSFGGWYTNKSFQGSAVTTLTGAGGKEVNLYAKWIPAEYTIKLMSPDGSNVLGEKKVKFDEIVALDFADDSAYKAEGKFISAWGRVPGEGQLISRENYDIITILEYISETEIAELTTIELYAFTENIEYTINYHVDDTAFANAGNPEFYTVDTPETELKPAWMEGSEWVGWYTDPELENKIDAIDGSMKKNLDLYPKWTPSEVTIVFETDTALCSTDKIASVTGTMEPVKVRFGQVTKLPVSTFKAVAKEGNETNKFKMWGWRVLGEDADALREDGSKTFFTFEEAELNDEGEYVIHLYPDFASEFKLCYCVDDTNYGVQNIREVDYTYGVGISKLSTPEKLGMAVAGYKFAGWYDEAGKKVTKIPNKTYGDVKLYAKFTEATYKVVYDLQGGTGNVKSTTVKYTGEINLPDSDKITKTGYYFDGWRIADTGYMIEGSTFCPRDYYRAIEEEGASDYTIRIVAIYVPKQFNVAVNTHDEDMDIFEFVYSDKIELKESLVGWINDANTSGKTDGWKVAGWYLDPELKKSAADYDKEADKFYLKKNIDYDVTLYIKVAGTYDLVLKDTENDNVRTYQMNMEDEFKIPSNPFKSDHTSQGVKRWMPENGPEPSVFLSTSETLKCLPYEYIDCFRNNELVLWAEWESQRIIFHANIPDEKIVENREIIYSTGEYSNLNQVIKAYNVDFNRDGYKIIGWYKEPECINQASINKETYSNVDVYAKWAGLPYTITYSVSGRTYTQDMIYGTPAKLLKPKYLSKYNDVEYWSTFDGLIARDVMYDGPSLYSKMYNSSTQKANIYFTGVLKCNAQIIFDVPYDCKAYGNRTTYYYYGTSRSAKSVASEILLVKEGYKFAGWYTDVNTKKAFKGIKANTKGNIVLYPKWTPENIKVVYKSNNAKAKGKMKNQTITYTKNANLKKCNYKLSGYKFAGWNIEGTDTIIPDKTNIAKYISEFPADKTITLIAMWELCTYKITYEGIECLDKATVRSKLLTEYTTDSSYELNYVYKPGYIFKGYYLDKKHKKSIKEIKAGRTGDLKIYAWYVETK